MPRVDDLLVPTMEALRALGESASISEIEEHVLESLKPTTNLREELHVGSTNKTELQYRLAWARTHLKWAGLVTNSRRGVWSFTPDGRQGPKLSARAIMAIKRGKFYGNRASRTSSSAEENDIDGWKEELLDILGKMDPTAFERLCQRLLRESGFSRVRVTGRSGDGGIDGRGLYVLGGLVTFPVLFQCKRHQGSVGPQIVRDFRGAMEGRADRGLILTTSWFTAAAHEEATRDGARPIDHLDGDQLATKLKELGLGVQIETVEKTSINPDWFRAL